MTNEEYEIENVEKVLIKGYHVVVLGKGSQVLFRGWLKAKEVNVPLKKVYDDV